jgi:hypothetical protein
LASTCRRRCSRVLTRSSSKARTSGLARTLEALALTVLAGTYNIVDDEPKRAYADALAAAAGKRVCLRISWPAGTLAGRPFNIPDAVAACKQRAFPRSVRMAKRTRRLDGHCQGPQTASGIVVFRALKQRQA